MALEHVTKRGLRAKTRREELGLTQEEVAERIQTLHAERNPGAERDKTRGQMISDYERGINDPRGARIELWAAALNWTVGDLEADKPATGSGDLMGSLNEAEEQVGLKRVEDQIAALREELLTELAELRSDLDVQRKQKKLASKTRAPKRS